MALARYERYFFASRKNIKCSMILKNACIFTTTSGRICFSNTYYIYTAALRRPVQMRDSPHKWISRVHLQYRYIE